MAIIPTKYGIAFEHKFLNQGGALVLVYRDGSVLISHGGMEMGQVNPLFKMIYFTTIIILIKINASLGTSYKDGSSVFMCS